MLRVRTGYSFRQAAGHPEDVIARLKEINCPYAPITDRANTFGYYRWTKLAKQAGLKPVLGVELAVTPSRNAKRPATDFWLFFPKHSLAPLNHLVSVATDQFRFQPLLTIEQALAATADCFVVMGHRPQVDFSTIEPKGLDICLGVSPATNRALVRQARERGIPLAATSDNHFPRQEDAAFYEILVGRNAEMQTYNQWLLSKEEWVQSVGHLGLPPEEIASALRNSETILASSKGEIQRAQLPVPERPGTLRAMCEAAAPSLKVDLSDPVYAERLTRELDLIYQKGYEDYFYIVAELCQWARREMIVGPARGSSCGSLVCYLLRITTIDPIPHGLIFERFVDINRTDMPDIDIDFSDQQRAKVFKHLSELYGHDHVARLGTVAMFKPRSALQEVAGALHIPRWKIESVGESIIERSSGDSRALNTLEDTLNMMPAGKKLLEEHPEAAIVTRFEGHPRHSGQHAAGVVIASKPISDYVAVDRHTGAAMCDKKDAEEGYNLLKIDALGLTQLSIFEDAFELAGLRKTGMSADQFLNSLPLDDQAAFDVLNKKQFAGIFQFNGMALQSIVQQFHTSQFDDLVSVTALARPGPLSSGGAHEWVKRKNGINPVTYPHPLFEPFLKDTLGIVLYQEQVMEIGRQIGDLDWGQVSQLRKAMSKSLGKEYFDQFGDPWKRAAIAKGVGAQEADKVWDDLCAYGAWSFNKSHSVAYGLISYWCCWMKAHHPFEFAAATLTHENDPHRQIQLLREMADEGIGYKAVDAKYSTDKWSVGELNGKRVLVGPLHNVHGIGPKLMQEYLSAREQGRKRPDRAIKLLLDPKTPLDSLWPIADAFKRIMPNPAARNIMTRPTPIGSLEMKAEDQEVVLFCTLSKINPRDENEAVMVARRGYEVTDGMTQSLNLQLTDDTGTVFGKISRYDYARLGQNIVDLGRTGKALYAIKGKFKGHGGDINRTFKMVIIKMVRLIGDMDENFDPEKIKKERPEIEEPDPETVEPVSNEQYATMQQTPEAAE